MPSNDTLNAGAGGATVVTKQVSHDGDTAKIQGVFLMGITGSEDAYTVGAINGDATNGIDVDVTRMPGTAVEDAAAAGGETGLAVLGVRNDAAAARTGTDGDFGMIALDSAGRVGIADLGGTITVDGTVALGAGAANIGDVDVLTLPPIPAGTNNIGDVDVLTLPSLPAGANNIGDVDVLTMPGTAAEDAVAAGGETGIFMLGVRNDAAVARTSADGDFGAIAIDSAGRVGISDLGGTITVDGSITVGAALPAGNNNIGDVDVASLPALPAGNNNIGDVDVVTLPALPAGNNNIGDVDVATLPGTFAEDSAHVSADLGMQVLAVRRDANTTLVNTDGDYAPVQIDANGGLKVSIIAGAGSGGTASVDDGAFTAGAGSGTPMMGFASADVVDAGDVGVVAMTVARGLHVNLRDDAGDSAMDGANNAVRVNVVAGSSGGVTHTDDAAFTVATDDGVPAFAMFDDATPDSVDEGDAGVLRMSANRNLYSTIRDAAGNERGANVTATNRLETSTTVDAALPAGTNNIGDVDVLTLPSLPAGANNIGDVDVLTSPGTFAEDAANASGDVGMHMLAVRRDTPAVSGDTDGDYSDVIVDGSGRVYANVSGAAASDAAVAGNPVRIGLRASADEPAAVSADGDAVDPWADRLGRQVFLEGHANPEAPVSVNATASGNTSVIAAPGASIRIYVRKASVHNRDTTNRLVALTDGAGGTVRWRAELQSEGGGSIIDFGSRGWGLTANTALNVNLDAAGNVDVNITDHYLAP